ncbi:MAG: transporter [Gammaproteobacteria bacterium]|nr:MAG: transporter [Gammaproteobacteria bacterium]
MNLSNTESLMMPVFMFLLMLGMGSTLSTDSFRQLLKQPAPALIGLLSQYGWMPLISMILALALDLSPPIALGLIITGCVAGGPISNFFTYIARGDLSLSISMTVISTLSGFVMIPLMLLIYTALFTGVAGNSSLEIPHGKIIATLLVIIIPVALGIVLRRRSLIWARRMEHAGSIAGFAMIVIIVAGILFRHSDTLMQIDASVYLAGFLLAPTGFVLGYLSALAMGLAGAQRRAVSLETGSQNVPLALAIILLSFPPEVQPEIMIVPILYGVTVVPFTALLAWSFRRIPDKG